MLKTFFIKRSCVLFLFLFVFIQFTKAQIIYTDVLPDSVFSAGNSIYSVDLNNDSIIDFNLKIESMVTASCGAAGTRTNKYLRVTPANTNNYVLNNLNLPRALSINSIIDTNSQFWKNTANQTMAGDTFRCSGGGGRPPAGWVNIKSGNFINTTDKYLAVRFYKDTQLFYGWIRFSITNNVIVTLKDYAYQSNGTPFILAGQTGGNYFATSVSNLGKLCVGDSINVGYVMSGNFDSTNVVSVEFSDSIGNFSQGTIVASKISNISGTIPCVIPPSFSGIGYRYRVKSSNPAQIASDNGTNLIINKNLPNNIITPTTNQVICNGLSVALTAPLENTSTYQWKKDSTILTGSTARIYNANTSGLFSCNISNGCGTVNSNLVSVTVITLPDIDITPSGTITIFSGDSVVLTPSVMDTSLKYSWYRSNLLNPISTAMTYTAKVAGTYSLEINHKVYGCLNTSPTLDIIVENRSEVFETNSVLTYLKVQPNPFSNNVFISFSIPNKQKYSVRILDITGRLVKTIATDVLGVNNFEYNWMADDENGNPINSGIFFLQLEAETFTQTQKLIMVR